MACLITCSIAVAFIVAAIYMFYVSYSSKPEVYEFERTLNRNQRYIYQQIVKERLKIYSIATIAGAILGVLYVIFMRKNASTTLSLVCSFVVIFFTVQILIYMIYPKSTYMLDHINTNEQAKAWMQVYNQMMKSYFIGFVLGLLGFAILCLAFLR